MRKPSVRSSLLFLILWTSDFCYGQGPSPVTWHFEAAPARGHETILFITADVAPGWHLYSQSIKEGGPIATQFRFDPNDNYVLTGATEEKGKAARFYDDIYEMEITWYAGIVTFAQRIILNKRGANIKGTVEYMTCNSEVCIPAAREFDIEVKP